jgi:uncharacterized protein YqjF (DUF2071 family)
MKRSTFLTAEWRRLAMANYVVDPEVLHPFVPAGVVLDAWQNTCYVSLVGFMFLDVRILGIPIPFHRNFEEVNLRFYVRYQENGTWKRGVVFIREFVPRLAITLVANTLYKENYETMAMGHRWTAEAGKLEVDYRWKKNGWHNFRVHAGPTPSAIETGSEHEFITEHYWGYARLNDRVTSQYEVQHPRWMCYPVRDYSINVDFAKVYGDRFAFMNGLQPASVLLAEGSEISIQAGSRIFV